MFSGGVKIGDATITPVTNADGVCTHLIGTVHDSSDLKNAEEEVRRKEEGGETENDN